VRRRARGCFPTRRASDLSWVAAMPQFASTMVAAVPSIATTKRAGPRGMGASRSSSAASMAATTAIQLHWRPVATPRRIQAAAQPAQPRASRAGASQRWGRAWRAAGESMARRIGDMYSRSSEPVRFERDCPAVLVPQGEKVTLPAGSVGYITQALGGSFTAFVEDNLFRIAGQDADAIGKEPAEPLELPEDAGDEDVEQLVWKQLRTCFDPEIPINIVDLGLVYEASVDHRDDGQRVVTVRMTLTAPGCGM